MAVDAAMLARRLAAVTALQHGGIGATRPYTRASLDPFLERQGVVILDGGVGTALGDEPQQHVLWGAQLLFGSAGHDRILSAHREFLEAGADIITSSSYQASFELFAAAEAFTNGTLPGGAITKVRV